MEGVRAEGFEYSYGMNSNDNSQLDIEGGDRKNNIFSRPRRCGEESGVPGSTRGNI